MIARGIFSLRGSGSDRSWESRRSVRSDPGDSYCVDFQGCLIETNSKVNSDTERTRDDNHEREHKLTNSTQATTILTVTGRSRKAFDRRLEQ